VIKDIGDTASLTWIAVESLRSCQDKNKSILL